MYTRGFSSVVKVLWNPFKGNPALPTYKEYFLCGSPLLQSKVFCFCPSFTSISKFWLLLKHGGANKKKIYIKTLKANPALPTYKEYFLCFSPNFNLKFSAFALVLLQFLDFGFCLNMGELTKNKKITPKLRYFFCVAPPTSI